MSSLPSDILLIERVDLISLTTVEGALYGLTFALYILCARSLYLQLEDRDWRRQRLFTLLYMSFGMALALSGLIVDTRSMSTSYIDHANYPGGGLGYFSDVVASSPAAIASGTTTLLLSSMMSGIQIWRLWIIWKASRYSLLIVIFPVLSLLAHIGVEVVLAVLIAGRSSLTPGLNAFLLHGATAFPLFTTITVTVLIIARILMVRGKHIKIMAQTDSTSPYTSVISMLIESFALESVWMIGTLSIHSPNPINYAINDFFMGTVPFIQLLAYLLVVHRAAMKREWKEDTEDKLTTLRWNHDVPQTTPSQIGTQASIPITHEEA